jgi:serine/threonine protein kinase
MFIDPFIGRQLANFRIERIIQRGGMAQVYFGLDVKLQRPVAIKVIDTFYRENPVYARRFIEEARLVATWSHENIIRIYYADDENGMYYFVMEYIDGSDLGHLLLDYTRRGDFMPYAEVLRIGRGIAAALDYAHERGVIHRDVKPSNVMVANDGRVILMDFGLALSLQGGSIGEAFGTPQYIAPEQANRSADAVSQSDIYSLGVILYELLTGTIPFDDPSAAALVIQHLLHEPPVPSQLNPALSEAVDQVLLKALRKKPEERYATGAELMDALAEALTQQPLPPAEKPLPALPPIPAGLVSQEITPTESPTPATTPSAFNWTLAGLIGLSLMIFLLIIWSLWPRQVVAEITPTVTLPLATATPTQRPTIATPTTIMGPLITTSMPTATPTASATPTATATPTSTPTHLPSPTPSPLFTVPSPVTEGHAIQLFYDETSFYLLNADTATIAPGLIAFEAIDSRTGEPAPYLFPGRLWSDFFAELEEGNCVRIETVEGPTWMRPQQCTDYNATVTPSTDGSQLVFWITRETVNQFRVMWLGQEVGRCQTNLGLCQIYLPE